MLRIPFLFLWNLLRLFFRFPFVALARLFARLQDGSVLHLSIKEDLPRWRHRPWWLFWQENEDDPTVEDWQKLLEKISSQPKITGVFCEFHDLHAGWTVVDELRGFLADLRQRQKHVTVYFHHLDIRGLYLASSADTILLSPAAHVEIHLPAIHSLFYGRLLDTLGIEPKIDRIGDHKGAPEPFLRSFPTPTWREDGEALLRVWKKQALEEIALARSLDLSFLEQTLEQGLFSIEEALSSGLIDGLRFPDRVMDFLQDPDRPKASEPEIPHLLLASDDAHAPETSKPDNAPEISEAPNASDASKAKEEAEEEDDPNDALISPDDFEATQASFWKWTPLFRKPKIAIIPIVGVIQDKESGGVTGGSQGALASLILEQIKEAMFSPQIKAAILFVDSRGGSALASERIWWAIRQMAEEKPTLAYLDQYAASGGYYVACGAKTILASPWTITGSIGVFGGKILFHRLLSLLQIGQAHVGETLGSRFLSASSPRTDDEDRRRKEQIHQTYLRFLARVAESRQRSLDEIHSLAEGRVYFGTTAREIGLIDACGGFDLAWREALKMADLSDADPMLFFGPERFRIQSLLQTTLRHLTAPALAAAIPRPSPDLQGLHALHALLPFFPTLPSSLPNLLSLLASGTPMAWLDLDLR